jgi:hypothetical protein
VNAPTIAPSVSVVNNNRYNRNRECTDCSYALYPCTGRCTNSECPRYKRTGGAITSDQILREFAPPRLFHGRRWGGWTLDTERLCLVYDAWKEKRGNGSGRTTGVSPYAGYFGKYEVDLESIRHSAGMLDWVFQVGKKSWATRAVTRDFLNALDSIFYPQANLCSGRSHKVIVGPKAFLRSRFETVGVAA